MPIIKTGNLMNRITLHKSKANRSSNSCRYTYVPHHSFQQYPVGIGLYFNYMWLCQLIQFKNRYVTVQCIHVLMWGSVMFPELSDEGQRECCRWRQQRWRRREWWWRRRKNVDDDRFWPRATEILQCTSTSHLIMVVLSLQRSFLVFGTSLLLHFPDVCAFVCGWEPW